LKVEKWSIRLRFEIEDMMNTFEGDEIMMKKPKIIQVEVDTKKCEIKVWKMKCEGEIWKNEKIMGEKSWSW